MDGNSLDILDSALQRLKLLVPEVFSENQLDWEKLKSVFSSSVNFDSERYILNWAGKSDALKTIQLGTTSTLHPILDKSINFPAAENLFIEGENLDVLKILQKSYYGKIKAVYIDPPYNTGSDSFVYSDRFAESKEVYQKRAGLRNTSGDLIRQDLLQKNGRENGHFHSNWLSMIYPRIYLAKNLLTEDGVIFIHIDDNEVHNLRMVLNEIFGEENFISQVVIETATDNNPSLVSNEHEYLLIFCKNKNAHSVWKKDSDSARLIQEKYNELRDELSNPSLIQTALRKWINQNKQILEGVTHYNNVDEKGVYHDSDIANPKFGGYVYPVLHPITGKQCKIPDKGFRYPEKTLKEMISNDEIVFGEDENTLIKVKKRLESSKEFFRSVVYNDGRAASKRLNDLIGRDIFKFPKDELLEKSFLQFVVGPNEIVLDFFGGSGTTAHAVLEMNSADGGNRKFILVQMPELCDPNSEAYKAGFRTIADIARTRIQKVIEKSAELTPTSSQGFKYFRSGPSNFKIWRGDLKGDDILQQLDAFVNPVAVSGSSTDLVYEIMLKSGYLLTDAVKTETDFFSVSNGALIIILDKIDDEIVKSVLEKKPQKVVILDHLFAANDQLKANIALQFQDAGIDLKTI